ncbi:MAG: RraA family protein [Synergistaceae bacterium]|jgi:4-hydroxy-4-methyl-2-oxoglutarate aldolase|nr:RraA family protein [Synergistaceae bacterium]
MKKLTEAFKVLPLGNICDANGKCGNMDVGIKPIDPLCKMAGLAFTVKGHPGDNAAIHKAIYEAPEGSILVVDVDDYCRGGHFGEIMATACMCRGIAGLVIDGTVRDANEIQELGFPVFCRGFASGGTQKEVIGVSGISIVCGGVMVNNGDIVVGNRDGVVVVGKDVAEEVLVNAQAIAKKEIEVLKLLNEGKSTIEIYRFKKLIQ